MERDPTVPHLSTLQSISTHTLTWSVTDSNAEQHSCGAFQLTRSRGAWHKMAPRDGVEVDFNSHAHVERDNLLRFLLNSYHYFNSHAHVERDKILFCWKLTFMYFNSHAHVERDWCWKMLLVSISHFNSHAHVERDVNIFDIFSFFHISTHTLTWSVTSASSSSVPFISFQLTRSRGAWRGAGGLPLPLGISTHTLTWSVTDM